MNAKERKRKSAKECKRVQKGAEERKRALLRNNCKQPDLKQPGLGTPKPLVVFVWLHLIGRLFWYEISAFAEVSCPHSQKML